MRNNFERVKLRQANGKQRKLLDILSQRITVVLVFTLSVTSLVVRKLGSRKQFGSHLSKWIDFLIITVYSPMVIELLSTVLVFLIEKYLLLVENVVYFVYGLRRSVRYFLWLGSVLLSWKLLICGDANGKLSEIVFNSLAACEIGLEIWILKIVLLKLLASRFYPRDFFARVQNLIYRQYVLDTLLWLKNGKRDEDVDISEIVTLIEGKHRKIEKGLKQKQQNNMANKGFNWVKSVLGHLRLFTICGALDKTYDDERGREVPGTLRKEEALSAASQIFKNMAKTDHSEIQEEDLLQFLNMDDTNIVLTLFEGAVERKSITKTSLEDWTVKVYNERRTLACFLNDTDTAIGELNVIVSWIILIFMPTLWLILMGIPTKMVLSEMLLKLLVLVIMFKKTIEEVIFVFLVHPFDAGDCCVIDKEQIVVEKVGLTRTVFKNANNESICTQNSNLRTKIISNLSRSPGMRESLKLYIDVSTSDDIIDRLKLKIKEYLETVPHNWNPGHSVLPEEINEGKLKMVLRVTHAKSFQNYEERNDRISELLNVLKKIFEDLGMAKFAGLKVSQL